MDLREGPSMTFSEVFIGQWILEPADLHLETCSSKITRGIPPVLLVNWGGCAFGHETSKQTIKQTNNQPINQSNRQTNKQTSTKWPILVQRSLVETKLERACRERDEKPVSHFCNQKLLPKCYPSFFVAEITFFLFLPECHHGYPGTIIHFRLGFPRSQKASSELLGCHHDYGNPLTIINHHWS